MVETRQISVKDGDVVVLVGTSKGAFMLRSSGARARWDMGGPYFPGHAVYAMAYDARAGRRRLWAGHGSAHWGPMLSSSDDFGRHWTDPGSAPIRFPEDSGAALAQIWQIAPGPAGQPDTIYAGVEPTALFVSRDAGASWEIERRLWDHPHRERWTPGGGGQCLHTIVPHPTDPDRLVIAMSTGGVYRTDDGGRSWWPRNVGVRAPFLPDKYPEFGQCVHKIVRHPARPERMFLQNHWGLYRSDDGGDSWNDIAHGVPSDFGFAMVMHPHDQDTVYVIPLESDGFRCTPEGKLRVYRTRDAGSTWEPLAKGLPQNGAFETVLRDGMAADQFNPAGIYFGTRSGQVWASPNGGASWSAIASGLPPVLCVKTAMVGEPGRVRAPRAPAKATGRKRVVRKAPARKTVVRKPAPRKATKRRS